MNTTVTITLPPGVTWDTQPAELYRHIYPQCAGLADLIGSIDDQSNELEVQEETHGEAMTEVERRNDQLEEGLIAAAKAMNTAADALFELRESIERTDANELSAAVLMDGLQSILDALTAAATKADEV